jgi:uncharacterized membrane protein YagU involved in acid resistance
MDKIKRLPQIILFAGLLTGTLDILAAIIQTYLHGGNPVKMFQYIASGVFGEKSFAGGLTYAFYGLAFHYAIAFAWTIFFFLIYPKMKFLRRNRLLAGMGYGAFIWIIMNLAVLPLSNVPQSPFHFPRAVTGMLILMAAIGLPLSYLASRFFSTDKAA